MLGKSVKELYNTHTSDEMGLLIGNGKTRSLVNLEEFSKSYVTFGCNILYRDFYPDYLMTVNINILREIIQNRVFEKSIILYSTMRNTHELENMVYDADRIFQVSILPFQGPSLNSGLIAAHVMLWMGFRKIHFVGVDMDDRNVYRGQHKEYMAPEYHSSRLNAFNRLIRNYTDVEWVQFNNTCLKCESRRV